MLRLIATGRTNKEIADDVVPERANDRPARQQYPRQARRSVARRRHGLRLQSQAVLTSAWRKLPILDPTIGWFRRSARAVLVAHSGLWETATDRKVRPRMATRHVRVSRHAQTDRRGEVTAARCAHDSTAGERRRGRCGVPGNHVGGRRASRGLQCAASTREHVESRTRRMGPDRQLRGHRTAHGRLCGGPSTRPSFGARCDVGPAPDRRLRRRPRGRGSCSPPIRATVIHPAQPSVRQHPSVSTGCCTRSRVFMVFGPLMAACFVFARRFAVATRAPAAVNPPRCSPGWQYLPS